jgi:Gluconate 2-dehydrogenase subunit 3
VTRAVDRHGGLTRRESLRRVALFAASSALPFGCTIATDIEATAPWSWPQMIPVSAKGYGTDPDLIHPGIPWPNTLDEKSRALVAALADILIPAEGDTPSASQTGVVDVLDEWISAPYPDQQADRKLLLAGFDWLDREAERRYNAPFVELKSSDQLSLIDDIAFPERAYPPTLAGAVQFMARLRLLVAGMFYSSPEGIRELGYVGNQPIAGDYPGPSEEALAHLQQQLYRLGLKA